MCEQIKKKSKNKGNRMVSSRYLNRYIKLNSSEEMQRLQLFPNAPEVTEVFSILNIIESYILKKDTNIDRNKENHVLCFVVGDGTTPRTAAVINFMTKWDTISCDPIMRNPAKYAGIKRCYVRTSKGEDIAHIVRERVDIIEYDYIFLIFPHSHIPNTNEIYKHFTDKKVWIINMPCCHKKQDDFLPLKEWVSFKDDAVASPENTIKVYCNYIDLLK